MSDYFSTVIQSGVCGCQFPKLEQKYSGRWRDAHVLEPWTEPENSDSEGTNQKDQDDRIVH